MYCKDCRSFGVCRYANGSRLLEKEPCADFINIDKWVEALKKQTPRKPVERGDGISYNCPSCGRYVGYIDAMAWEMPKYCDECGQALKWAGVEGA